MTKSSYVIYNASAGSGKTFTLVKSFLKIILGSPNPDVFKTLLAITFTNKAVNEMKRRVIETLMKFSQPQGDEKDAMFQQISNELQISESILVKRSSMLLKQILHNYSALTITTIDGFNHRLIRNFAFDLRLNPNFEVFLDVDQLLKKAVENLLKRTGEDEQITNFLTEFSRDKIREDKHWDVTQELLEVSKLLTIENHFEYLRTFQNKTLDDFERLKSTLKQRLKLTQENMVDNAINFFKIADQYQWTEKHFNRGYLYKFFKKIKEEPQYEPKLPFEQNWILKLEEAPLYANKIEREFPDIAQELDEHQGIIILYFRNIEQGFYKRKFYRVLLKNLIPLAILRSIQQEIELIKEEENILPISEFNNIIYQTISQQPVPFIYERIGQRYRHYFIDEFQDTSALQWYNMLPLISDALQSETLSQVRGSLLLVGDAKQSIYRWRGGKAEQFMDLYLKESNPFFVNAEVVDLDKNFRSCEEIIKFNNDFFQFIAEKPSLFKTELYKNLCRNAIQKTYVNTPKDGYVSIRFLALQDCVREDVEINSDSDKIIFEELYNKAVLSAVADALDCNFRQQDICVLTRTNKQGVVLAQVLTEKGYKVISPDALLLKNVPEVQFLISLIKLSLQPDNKEVKSQLLLIYTEIKQIEDIHSFMSKYIDVPLSEFLDFVGFSMKYFHQYSLYEGICYAIEQFHLAKKSDAYLSHFMDFIFEFKSSNKGTISDFLVFWEDKKENLSISVPNGIDAINVMTIHKSKGLEYPVIIYAYVNDNVTPKKDKIWLKLDNDQEDFEGFEYLLIDNFKGLKNIKEQEILLQEEQQMLDHLNVMYVAMTRPESHLYIISEQKKEKIDEYNEISEYNEIDEDDDDEIKNFADILEQFLKSKKIFDNRIRTYEFGKKVIQKEKEVVPSTYLEFVQRPWQKSNYKIVTRKGFLWQTKVENAIEKGNIIHELLSKIYTFKDISPTLLQAQTNGIITEEQSLILEKQLNDIVNNEFIKYLYTDSYAILNETEFINDLGQFERPDRIVLLPDNQVIVVDYKTGNFYPKYIKQIHNYAKTLSKLGWNVQKGFLVFIGSQIDVQEIKI